jgi:hypothetical protein
MTASRRIRLGRLVAIAAALTAIAAGAPGAAYAGCGSGTHYPDGTIVSR